MGGLGDVLFGSKGTPSGPKQSKRFQEGQDLLEDQLFGALRGQQAANRGFAATGGAQRGGFIPARKGQLEFPGAPGGRQTFGGPQQQTFGAPQQPLGFQQAGQAIAGQIGPQTRDFRFQQPDVQFGQRDPFQFQAPEAIQAQDAFTPQFELAQRGLQEQFSRGEEERLADLNRRGLLTTGAATRSQNLAREESNRRLTDLASRFSIEQGQAQFGEEQQRRGLEQQRQFNQAAEIFRQQGASDQQAQFLAGLNFQTQQAQQQANLATQGQRFQEQIGGRQLGLQEEQLAQFTRRQPLEDVFRLQLAQFGQQGGTPAQPGIIPSVLGQAAGAAAGAFI